MSEGTPITREGVEHAYRYLLGRPPENEKAYQYGLSAGTVETLRRWILNSAEFSQKLRRDAPHALRRSILDELQMPPAEAPPSVAEGRPRIVFLHMMKTAGTSIRRRLEELAEGEPVFRREKDGRPGDVPAADLARYRVVMGHFNILDARHVPEPRRIFTVLREPRERLVSFYHFLHRHRAEVVEERGMERARIARACTLEQFLAHPDPGVRGTLQNVMTCTLAGDYRPIGADRYLQPWESPRDAITGPELLRRALGNLFALDFVTFVDRLEEDRPRLMQALGLPDTGPLPRENTRDEVNPVVEPRPEPEITPRAGALLRRLTDLDRVLYGLARQHYG
ncbi:sulfotransferase family 2 domain-containing protein [Falsiroseomonas oryzae]|uniref:sulfotransferase family 2 domain-containing protein n=1 Tax=Falsiroseomonas oryzae TaxID=2766473 RepID=UPI0022EB65F2|nr:sulfotransferase family 2 domain-containing protein [Roseomonas sp. MO-31]